MEIIYEIKCHRQQGDVNEVWIVLAPFLIMGYINDASYLRSDGAQTMVKTISVRETNVQFVQMIYVGTPRDLTSHRLIVFKAF